MSAVHASARGSRLAVAVGLVALGTVLCVWRLAPVARDARRSASRVATGAEPLAPAHEPLLVAPAPPADAERAPGGERIVAPEPAARATRGPAPRRAVRDEGTVPEGAVLDVLVLDALGAPAADVEVACKQRGDVPIFGPPWTRRTTLDGRARFVLPSAERLRMDSVRFLELGAVVPVRHAPRVELAADGPAHREVVLRLPPTGALALEVVDARGEPVAGALATLKTSDGSGDAVHAVCDVVEGRASFAWVEAGLSMDLRVAWSDQGGRAADVRLGALAAGEVRDVRVEMPSRWPLVAMRVLSPDGKPLRHTGIQARITHDPLSPQVVTGTTDEAGRLVLEVVGSATTRIPRRLELVREADELAGRVDLGCALSTDGPTELGDVHLSPLERVLLAAGTVRDDRGPLGGVRVSLEPERSRVTRVRRTETDAAGRFEFHGFVPDETLTLHAYSGEHLPMAPLEVEPGAANVVLELARAARLVVELALDEGMGPGTLQVLARTEDDVRRLGIVIDPATEARGTFAYEAVLAPETFAVEVRSAEGALLARVAEVRVEVDRARDPRLHPLDLRGRLALARLELRGSNGARLGPGYVTVGLPDGTRGTAFVRDDGRLVLVLPPDVAEVELAPEGLASRTVPVRGGWQTVTFAPR